MNYVRAGLVPVLTISLMLNVCENCSSYRVDKIIDAAGPFAICPECNHSRPFRHLPILFVCGASGTGKSTILNALIGVVDTAVILDGDILWRPDFNTPEDNFQEFFETWLRLAKNITQSGKPVVIFNAGSIPNNVEPCTERRYFSESHYLALVCDDKALKNRLRQRPPWRQCDDTFIKEQIRFNRWLKKNSRTTTPVIKLLDTNDDAIPESANKVALWIQEKIQQ